MFHTKTIEHRYRLRMNLGQRETLSAKLDKLPYLSFAIHSSVMGNSDLCLRIALIASLTVESYAMKELETVFHAASQEMYGQAGGQQGPQPGSESGFQGGAQGPQQNSGNSAEDVPTVPRRA